MTGTVALSTNALVRRRPPNRRPSSVLADRRHSSLGRWEFCTVMPRLASPGLTRASSPPALAAPRRRALELAPPSRSAPSLTRPPSLIPSRRCSTSRLIASHTVSSPQCVDQRSSLNLLTAHLPYESAEPSIFCFPLRMTHNGGWRKAEAFRLVCPPSTPSALDLPKIYIWSKSGEAGPPALSWTSFCLEKE
jgi:hypothetical protein